MIVAIKYFKKIGEFFVTTRNSVTGKKSTVYANTLTDSERA